MEKMSYVDIIMNKNSNYDESSDAIVPDLYPDISKILMVTGKSYVKETTIQSDRVLISGEIKCDVLYLSEENENIIKMNVNLSFAHIEELKEENTEIFCNSYLSNIEARIINPRKISILANTCIDILGYKEESLKYDKTKTDDLEVLKTTKDVLVTDSVNICDFVLSDEVEFLGLQENVEILSLKPKIIVNDIKLLKNKLMIRGNIEFSGYYLDNYEIMPINSVSPFSQILDVLVNDENLECFIESSIKNFELEEIGDFLYSYTLSVKLCVVQKKKIEVSMILDMYDPSYEIEVEQINHKMLDVKNPTDERIEHSLNLPFACETVLIMEAFCYVSQVEDGKYDVFASIRGLLKTNSSFEGFSHTVKILENEKFMTFDNVNVKVTRNLGDSLDILISANSKKYEYEKIDMPIVTNVTKTTEKPKDGDEIILKYISTKTKIWDIAKLYSVKEEDILNANEIQEKYVQNKMILIPKS